MWTRLKELFTIKGKEVEEPPMEEAPVMTVWNIIEGPYDIDGEQVLIVNAELNGKLDPVGLHFDNFNDAYDIVKYFKAHIYPLKFPLDGGKPYV